MSIHCGSSFFFSQSGSREVVSSKINRLKHSRIEMVATHLDDGSQIFEFKNGSLTKHPLKIHCFRFQVVADFH